MNSRQGVSDRLLVLFAPQFQRGVLVALGLDQHIQNLALGVDGAPQVNHAPGSGNSIAKRAPAFPLTRACRPPQGKDGCVSGNAARGFLRRPNLGCGLFTGPDCPGAGSSGGPKSATPPRAPIALGCPRLSGGEPTLQDLVLGLQGLDVGSRTCRSANRPRGRAWHRA